MNKLIFSCFVLLFSVSGKTQCLSFFDGSKHDNPLSDLRPNVKKLGPYFGYEQGLNSHLEAGGEFMYKRIRFKNRILFGLNAGLSYALKPKVVCYDIGAWWKIGRIGFTYGATAGAASNFNIYQFRFSPTIGIKLGIFHIKSGIYLYPGSSKLFERNTFFLSARVTFVKHKDFDWR